MVVGAITDIAIPQQDIDAVASRIQSAMMAAVAQRSSGSPRLLPKGITNSPIPPTCHASVP